MSERQQAQQNSEGSKKGGSLHDSFHSERNQQQQQPRSRRSKRSSGKESEREDYREEEPPSLDEPKQRLSGESREKGEPDSILRNSQEGQVQNTNQDLGEGKEADQMSQRKDTTSLNINRIHHLEEIFRHYCTHIFRVGKYMTFERLEYEKVHMTIDRFFVFLKDFQLTIAVMSEQIKPREIVPKATVIMLFKKISSNAKDLTFEEFILCIEKLAIVYEDNYRNILVQGKEKSRVAPGLKKIPKKRLQFDENQEENKQGERGEEVQKEGSVDEFGEKVIRKVESFLGLDDQEPAAPRKEVESKSMELAKTSEAPGLSDQEKINKFYKKIGVDSIREYRIKMGSLNLSLFRPAAKSVDLKPRHSPTMEQRPEITRVQEMRERIRILKQKTPRKLIQYDPETNRTQEHSANMRYQKLINGKSGDRLMRGYDQRQGTTEVQGESLASTPTVQLSRKRKAFNSIKVAQQVSKAVLQKLGVMPAGSHHLQSQDEDQDEKYLIQYKIPSQPEPSDDKIKPSISQRLLGQRKKPIRDLPVKYDNKIILNRKKSKSSVPASSPYSSITGNNPRKQQTPSIPKGQKIVSDAKKRAAEIKRFQILEESSKNDLIKKIGRAKFLSNNR